MHFSNLKQIIFSVLGKLLRILGLQNVLLIEAELTKRENTEAVFREILRRGWNEKYHIVLYSNAPATIAQWKTMHVSVIKRPTYGDDWRRFLQMWWMRARSRMIIDENLQARKYDPKTIHVFLSHGSCLKSVRSFYSCKPDTDFMLSQSAFWKPINEYQLRISPEKLVTLGFPRNDILFHSELDPASLFGRKFSKIVVWYPTYRQYKGYRDKGLYQADFSVPVIHDADAANRINAYAAKYDILVVVKPHPVQDVSFIDDLNLSHMITVNDRFFLEHQTTDYAFLAKADALITDYSSVLFDFLLTKKPIALTLEDYEQYKEQIGLAVDMDLIKPCCTLLNTPEEFDAFFHDLSEENDPLREKRDELMHLTNQYTDGNSTKRVVDWLETLLK